MNENEIFFWGKKTWFFFVREIATGAHHVTSALRCGWPIELSVTAEEEDELNREFAVLEGPTAVAVVRRVGATAAGATCLLLRSPMEKNWSAAPAASAWCPRTAPSTAPSPWTSRTGSRIKRCVHGADVGFWQPQEDTTNTRTHTYTQTADASYRACWIRFFRSTFSK